ncbi:MAG TPA: alpha/beta fold hydrolase [Nocardioidaceae bacterium]|nr:alpha/beta fold hydrolase [Nocardioidaceae bacterium]
MSEATVTGSPGLTTYRARRSVVAAGGVRGVALMLHGGRQQDERLVERTSTSWLRMVALARMLSRAAAPRGVAVELLRYRARGWNARPGREPAPVVDGRWALEQLRDRYGPAPIVLVGHSMGGRTACALADAAGVSGVVALAPWLPPGEPVAPAAGQRLVLAHGQADRWTSAAGSLEWSRRARRSGARVARYDLGPVGHFMLSQVGQWNGLVRDAALGLLDVGVLPAEVVTAFTATGDDGLRLPPTW